MKTVRIKRIFNNNAILAADDSGGEKVFFGSGLGFKANVGEAINMDKVEKTFAYENDEGSSRLQRLLNNVPENVISLSYNIVEYCQNNLQHQMSDYLFVTLTDHLNFALQMYDRGQVNPNMIMWEIKRYYPKEFELGQRALTFIYEETGKQLDEYEAGHIALHLINAQLNSGDSALKSNVVEITHKINEILNIIKYRFKVEMDIKSFDYERLVFHLRHFLTRISGDNKSSNSTNEFLLEQVVAKYPEEFKCAKKIGEYLGKDLDIDENLYLTMHIARVVN